VGQALKRQAAVEHSGAPAAGKVSGLMSAADMHNTCTSTQIRVWSRHKRLTTEKEDVSTMPGTAELSTHTMFFFSKGTRCAR